MLPKFEVEAFDVITTHAGYIASAGAVRTGRSLLLAGMRGAEQARDCGEPWADELLACYRCTLEAYDRKHPSGRAPVWCYC